MVHQVTKAHLECMKTLPFFFSPSMVADSGSYSPSASKPAQVVASWKRLGIPLTQHDPEPVTVEEFARAHDEAFVRGVLEGRVENGFGSRSKTVAASLPWTSGAMRSAARHAWKHGGVALAPCSGFHHAAWGNVAGFCTFNGLMVTATALKAEGARRVGILDFDMHYGDGTDDIIDHLEAASWVTHFTAGRTYRSPSQASAFFARLPEILRSMAECDVVLYQAGADPHVDDPLGGWLTTAQLAERDARVFEGFKELGVPVAWNLAGGYQREKDGSIPKVLEIHDNTLRACARVFDIRGA
jgi:acetoin utilization deacetylase AcuC-like enzyme